MLSKAGVSTNPNYNPNLIQLSLPLEYKVFIETSGFGLPSVAIYISL